MRSKAMRGEARSTDANARDRQSQASAENEWDEPELGRVGRTRRQGASRAGRSAEPAGATEAGVDVQPPEGRSRSGRRPHRGKDHGRRAALLAELRGMDAATDTERTAGGNSCRNAHGPATRDSPDVGQRRRMVGAPARFLRTRLHAAGARRRTAPGRYQHVQGGPMAEPPDGMRDGTAGAGGRAVGKNERGGTRTPRATDGRPVGNAPGRRHRAGSAMAPPAELRQAPGCNEIIEHAAELATGGTSRTVYEESSGVPTVWKSNRL